MSSSTHAEIAARQNTRAADAQQSPFGVFVNKQHALAKKARVGAAQRKREWLEALDALYEKVDDFLQPHISSGEILIEKSPITLRENLIGNYTVQQMSIWLGNSEVKLKPVGTCIIAAKGHVDMLAPERKMALVFVSKSRKTTQTRALARTSGKKTDDSHVWKILEHQPRINYITLDKKTFRAALMNLVKR